MTHRRICWYSVFARIRRFRVQSKSFDSQFVFSSWVSLLSLLSYSSKTIGLCFTTKKSLPIRRPNPIDRDTPIQTVPMLFYRFCKVARVAWAARSEAFAHFFLVQRCLVKADSWIREASQKKANPLSALLN